MNVLPIQRRRSDDFIEAVQVTQFNAREVAEWCDGAVHWWAKYPHDVACVALKLAPFRTDIERAEVGQYVVRHARGFFRVYDAGDFDAIFETVPET